jgi:hypothetical protein
MLWKRRTEIGHYPDKIRHLPGILWLPVASRPPNGYSLSRAMMIEPTSATNSNTEATSKGRT